MLAAPDKQAGQRDQDRPAPDIDRLQRGLHPVDIAPVVAFDRAEFPSQGNDPLAQLSEFGTFVIGQVSGVVAFEEAVGGADGLQRWRACR